MGIALDAFGWMPGTFWRSTPVEFFAMTECRRKTNEELERAAR